MPADSGLKRDKKKYNFRGAGKRHLQPIENVGIERNAVQRR